MREVGRKTIWDMALTRDVDGYAIKPHSDNARKWVTAIYYLSKQVLLPPTPCSRARIRVEGACRYWHQSCEVVLNTAGFPFVVRVQGDGNEAAGTYILSKLPDGVRGQAATAQDGLVEAYNVRGSLTGSPTLSLTVSLSHCPSLTVPLTVSPSGELRRVQHPRAHSVHSQQCTGVRAM
jgi:hypothetical protein